MKPVIVFDLDDTLYPEREYVRSGIAAVSDAIRDAFGRDIRKDLLTSWESGERDFLTKACRILQQPDSLKESLLWIYRLHFPSIALPSDSRRAIDACLQRGCTVAILTDGRSLTQRLKLRALGLASLPAYISEDWQSEKPHPLRFTQIMADFPADHYAYIGDNPAKDFKAPKDLGWITICVQHGGEGVHSQSHLVSDPSFEPQLITSSLAEAVTLAGLEGLEFQV
jgi:putative hydrolase of the HAD superfamily